MDCSKIVKSKKLLKAISDNEGLLDEIGRCPDSHLTEKYTATLYTIKKIRKLLGIPTYAEVPAYRLIWKRGTLQFMSFVEVVSQPKWTYKQLGAALKCSRQRAFQIYKSCLKDDYTIHDSIASEYARLSVNRTEVYKSAEGDG